jgi:hypothetical protein
VLAGGGADDEDAASWQGNYCPSLYQCMGERQDYLCFRVSGVEKSIMTTTRLLSRASSPQSTAVVTGSDLGQHRQPSRK